MIYLQRLYGGFPFSEEEKGGEGKGGGGKGKEDQPKYLTQEEVNSILAKERRGWEDRLRKSEDSRTALETKLNEMSGEFDQFKSILQEATQEVEEEERQNANRRRPDSTGDPALDEYIRELEIPAGIKDKETYVRLKKNQFASDRQVRSLMETVAQQNKAIDELKARAETEERARLLADQARQEALRNATVTDALVKNRCIDPETAVAIFAPRVTFDDKNKEFTYKMKDGSIVSVHEGISKEIPPYLVTPVSPSGGSGAGGGGRAPTTPTAALDELKAKMASAYENFQKKPTDGRAQAEYQRAKREVKEAEAAAAAGNK